MKVGIRSCSSISASCLIYECRYESTRTFVAGTCVQCGYVQYPYPHPSVPIPMCAGSGFRRVWVRVGVKLPMGYP